jgi:hypothetical protein
VLICAWPFAQRRGQNARREGNKGRGPQNPEVDPVEPDVDPADAGEQGVVVEPDHPDVEERDGEGEVLGPLVQKLRPEVSVTDFRSAYLEDQEGDDYREGGDGLLPT